MDDYSSNSVEYIVEKKPEGSYLTKRILLIAGYILISAIYCAIMIKTFFPMIAILPLIMIWIIIPKTWCYVAAENQITVVSGVFTFTQLYGKKRKKKFLEVKVKDMTLIAPMNDEYREKSNDPEIKKTYDARSSESSPDAYFAIYKNESGEKECIFFDASMKMLQIMKFYNKDATVMSDNLRH